MNVLLDSCVWSGARGALAERGHDVLAVADVWGEDPGDAEILRGAHDRRRILVTLDKDFGELAIVKGLPHAGIVRLGGIRARDQGPVAAQAIELHGEPLAAGAIVTVEADRIRVRSKAP